MVYDCRKKEKMLIKRKGGDLAIIFIDLKKGKVFETWFEIKKPAKETYEKIKAHFEAIKNLLERQDASLNVENEK